MVLISTRLSLLPEGIVVEPYSYRVLDADYLRRDFPAIKELYTITLLLLAAIWLTESPSLNDNKDAIHSPKRRRLVERSRLFF